MLYIFGWGKETIKDHGPLVPAKCWNCHNIISYRLIKAKKWLTFFFIPVIPYEAKYYLSCDICSRRIEISPQQAAQIQSIRQEAQKYLFGSIDDEQYKSYLSSIGLSHLFS